MNNQNVMIYHNPRCSKSRETLLLLKENNIEPIIKYYLEQPLNQEELMHLMACLKVNTMRQIIRNKESLYHELTLNQATESQLIDAVIKHPILLERPIVIYRNNAKIGRPPEVVLSLF